MAKKESKIRDAIVVAKTIEFQRADPEELAKFDPTTKVCTMNCGPHVLDPRTTKERKFLCADCMKKGSAQ